MDLLQQLLALIFDPRTVRLKEHDRTFNPLRILGVEHLERQHVKTLAWLLDPSESHGFGNSFFMLFMRAVSEKAPDVNVQAQIARSGDGAMHVRVEVPTAALSNLAKSEADAALHGTSQDNPDGEGSTSGPGYLDMLLRGSGWLVAVEAKIHSRLHNQQLKRYRTALKEGAPKDRRLLVYLDCDEGEPQEDQWDEQWVHVTWQDAVVEPLRLILGTPSRERSERPEISFLRSYVEVLEKQCGMQDSVREDLLGELLEAHADLLPRLRSENLSDEVTMIVGLHSTLIRELSDRFQSASMKRYPTLKEMIVDSNAALRLSLTTSSPSVLRFLPASWLTEFPWIHETGPYPRVVCEMFNHADRGVQFKLMICDLGSGFADKHHLQRRQLLELIQGDRAHSASFPGAFLANGAQRDASDRYFGVLRTPWLASVRADDPVAVRQYMEERFLPSVKVLTGLMHKVNG